MYLRLHLNSGMSLVMCVSKLCETDAQQLGAQLSVAPLTCEVHLIRKSDETILAKFKEGCVI